MSLGRFLLPAALAAMPLTAVPALAEDNLDCVAGGYSDEQQAAIEEFRDGYDFESLRNPSHLQELGPLLRDRVLACAEEQAWSEEATAVAGQYAPPALFSDVILHAMPLDPLQKFELLTRYQEADRAALIDAISAVSGTRMFGREPREATDADRATLDAVLRVEGVPDSYEYGAWLGSWLSMTLQRDIAKDRFSTL